MNKKESELYLKTYPKLLKWINECPACHSKGYKPEMINSLEGSIAKKNLIFYFKPLEIDELGLCLQCSKLLNKKK